jgi:DNA-binding NarL/FixJ family response regulator
LSIRILIVDDSRILRRAVRICIEERTDWEICGEAPDGRAAVEMAAELRPDLIILDLSLPVMNGLEAARRISQTYPNLPMILFTMLDCNDLVRNTAEAAGIKHVFSKSDGFGTHVLAAIRSLLYPPDSTASLVG